MDRLLISTLLFFALSAAAAGAVVEDPEDYWHEVLPNTPIPRAIKTLLCPDLLREIRDAPVKTDHATIFYHYDIHTASGAATETQARDDPDAALLFLEQDLHPNARTSKQLRFIRNAHPAPFVPRSVAGAMIPFSSENLPELLARFSLKPDSVGAEDMRATLHKCERHAPAVEVKSCVTSLESMVDFATTNLGTRDVRASSTEVDGDELRLKQQSYTVAGVESLQEGGRAVVCHAQPAPYAVFYCHATDGATRAYKVRLVGEDDGSKVTAAAVCHVDTSAWNPGHLAFRALKVKPGSAPVCHFLRQDVVVWTAGTSWEPTHHVA